MLRLLRRLNMARLSLYEHPDGCTTEGGNVVVYDMTENVAHFGAASVSGPALRWELEVGGDGAGASLSEEIELPAGPLIMRADRIDFPPGGIAYRHTHPGPGIRRLVMGTIRIETCAPFSPAAFCARVPDG